MAKVGFVYFWQRAEVFRRFLVSTVMLNLNLLNRSCVHKTFIVRAQSLVCWYKFVLCIFFFQNHAMKPKLMCVKAKEKSNTGRSWLFSLSTEHWVSHCVNWANAGSKLAHYDEPNSHRVSSGYSLVPLGVDVPFNDQFTTREQHKH
jgi:hypothetical protein